MREKKALYVRIVITAIASMFVLTVVFLGRDRAERIYFAEQNIEMDVNTAMNLAPILLPADINRGRITYYSGDNSIAEYNNDVIIAKAVGECTLLAECDGVVSDVVYVRVRDYMEEACKISEDIDEYIQSGNMSSYKANELYSEFLTLPENIRKRVENAWKMYIYMDFSQDTPVAYISKSKGKYHLNSHCVKGLIEVPLDIAIGEGLSPCSRCVE